jgi:transposase InsO family protein
MCKRPKTTFVINSVNITNLAIAKIGPELLGPLPPAQGNLKYVVVAVEYFSKWIEAKPLATITSVIVQKFF